ncbi:MAG TPA: tetratricopeptide repeat protein [Nitrospirota bacterium]|nr:tetratricopeptide repeat protein [Nitrospirota bacterium]
MARRTGSPDAPREGTGTHRFLALLAASFVLFAAPEPAFPESAAQNTYIRCVKNGHQQMKAGDYQAARDAFREALQYIDDDAAAHLGLGLAYFHLGDDTGAERELTRAAGISPNSWETYQWLGEVHYRQDNLEEAAQDWERAAELNPSSSEVRARLERIRREHQTEKDFNRDVTSHFLVKYEGREKIEAGKIVLRILEDAYGEVGRGLAYYPDREIQVILYSSQQFQEVTDAPGWSGGIFDGKIRIPIGGIEKETPGLRKLLFHEYTHAVVRSIVPRCPTWINEGLAQYFEGREIDAHQREIMRRMAQSGKLPSLSDLEGSFMSLNNDQAFYAYLFSLSSIRYAVDTFGMYRVKMVLEQLGSGADTGKAIDKALMISYEEFDRGWKRSLE